MDADKEVWFEFVAEPIIPWWEVALPVNMLLSVIMLSGLLYFLVKRKEQAEEEGDIQQYESLRRVRWHLEEELEAEARKYLRLEESRSRGSSMPTSKAREDDRSATPKEEEKEEQPASTQPVTPKTSGKAKSATKSKASKKSAAKSKRQSSKSKKRKGESQKKSSTKVRKSGKKVAKESEKEKEEAKESEKEKKQAKESEKEKKGAKESEKEKKEKKESEKEKKGQKDAASEKSGKKAGHVAKPVKVCEKLSVRVSGGCSNSRNDRVLARKHRVFIDR
ncbi:hypothetical protein Y032_0143g2420 [Ancylostoma ceylanicum]|uniref:Uncharacterized protein n=1 Tax=Ancylostoma ceylanicum TaxID=53326 RepID=A0A016T3J6_9BILA|nr:hypothetical protein Y032_0143g2420 [Ancylostoma ceylanicum]